MKPIPRQRRILAALVAAGALAGMTGTAAAAPGTSADGRDCASNSKVFARGGATHAQRTVTVRLCVERTGVELRATGQVSMGPKQGAADIVYHLTVSVRLERHDKVIASASCDATAWTNHDDNGGNRFTCAVPTRFSSDTARFGSTSRAASTHRCRACPRSISTPAARARTAPSNWNSTDIHYPLPRY